MEIRILTLAELERAAHVIRRGYSTVAEEFKLTLANCPTNGAFLRTERLVMDFVKDEMIYGLYVDDVMQGVLQMQKTNDKVFYIKKLAVHPKFRHQGYGSALLQFAIEKSTQQGAERLELCVMEDDAALKKWILSKGFTHNGVKHNKNLPFALGKMEMLLTQKSH